MGLCRELGELVPELQEKAKLFLAECKKEGIDVLVVETYRNNLVQKAYYLQGRELLEEVNTARVFSGLPKISLKENKKITNTKAGQSKHNIRKAFDCVPLVNDKPCWSNSELFTKIGAIGKKCGLKWGGDFKSIKDSPHFEL